MNAQPLAQVQSGAGESERRLFIERMERKLAAKLAIRRYRRQQFLVRLQNVRR